MFKSQKNVFWQALLFTILLIGVGIVFGIILEDTRTANIDKLYQQSEIDLMDLCNGTYLLEVISGDKNWTQQLIVNH